MSRRRKCRRFSTIRAPTAPHPPRSRPPAAPARWTAWRHWTRRHRPARRTAHCPPAAWRRSPAAPRWCPCWACTACGPPCSSVKILFLRLWLTQYSPLSCSSLAQIACRSAPVSARVGRAPRVALPAAGDKHTCGYAHGFEKLANDFPARHALDFFAHACQASRVGARARPLQGCAFARICMEVRLKIHRYC